MTTTPAMAEEDLAVAAAGGDAAAFAILYRRHIEAAWRLAQAVTSSADEAARATSSGFVSVVRLVARGRDDVADHFRPHVLAAVYREAHVGRDPSPSSRPTTKGAAGPVLVAAFANLPARWRAALWLEDVERLPATEVGPILGVTSASAVQLTKQGRAGLVQRAQRLGAGSPLGGGEGELAPVLTATIDPLPPGLQATTEARWGKAVAHDRRRRGGWLSERAPAPLAACIVGLCAVGIIGLAVVGQSATVKRLPTAGPATLGRPGPGTSTGNINLGGGATTPAAGTGQGSSAAGTSTTGSAAAQGPRLIATEPSTTTTIVVIVPTTVAPVTATTVPTVPPTTAPPISIPPISVPPITTPPVTTPPVTTPPVAQPLLQVSVNATPVAVVNLGLGQGSCTGVNLLGIKLGCTTAPPGLTLKGTLLGGL